MYCIRTLTKHLEMCCFNSIWKWNEYELLQYQWIHCEQLSSVCLSVGFFFYKDVNARARSPVIIAVEHTQRTSGNRSIWSARVLAAVPSLGKFFCCLLVNLPFLYANLRYSFILCKSWPQVFLRFFTKIILTERTTLRPRLSSPCYVFAFFPLSGMHNTDKSLLWHSYVVFSSILLPANE